MNRIRKSIEQTPEFTAKSSQDWHPWYVLARHWQSDVIFFKDELRFLHLVIRKFLMWLTEDENILSTRAMENKISEAEVRRRVLDLEITKHTHHIHELMQNPFVHDDSVLHKEHMKLEIEWTAFIKDFRALKGGVFELTERVHDSEDEANQLLAP